MRDKYQVLWGRNEEAILEEVEDGVVPVLFSGNVSSR